MEDDDDELLSELAFTLEEDQDEVGDVITFIADFRRISKYVFPIAFVERIAFCGNSSVFIYSAKDSHFFLFGRPYSVI